MLNMHDGIHAVPWYFDISDRVLIGHRTSTTSLVCDTMEYEEQHRPQSFP
jgi:hypothetical protein